MHILSCLYKGYGTIKLQPQHQRDRLNLPEQLNKSTLMRKLIDGEDNGKNFLKKAHLENQKVVTPVNKISEKQFSELISNRGNSWFNDATIVFNNSLEIKVNKILLIMSSDYFRHVFSENYQEKYYIEINLSKEYFIVFDILINYLQHDFLLVPQSFSIQSWMELCELSDYFSVGRLKNICENQLCHQIVVENLKVLSNFSIEYSLEHLAMHCADYQIKNSLIRSNYKINQIIFEMESISKRPDFTTVKKLFEAIKFDLTHNNIQKQVKKEINFMKKKFSEAPGTE